MKTKLLLILFALLFGSASVNAIELKIVDDDLTETQRYTEDYLFAGEALDFQGEARDLFFFTEKMEFSGKSGLALNGVARNIEITGEVNNGVKAAGRSVDINGQVRGTSFLAGERVTIGPEGQMAGDTFIGARRVSILGKHTGDMRIGAAEISIQNVIHGNVTAHTGQLKISEQGKIIGNLTYHSDQELSPDEASRVTGDIIFEFDDKRFFDDHMKERSFHGPFWLSLLFKVSFIVFGLLILLFPVTRLLEKRYTRKELLSHSLWGLIPVFVYPTAIIVSILLVITLPMAAALALAFMPILFITKVLGITMIGGYLADRFGMNSTSRFLYFLIGVILYSLLSLIPIFGGLMLVFVSTIGCGLILSALFNKKLA